MAGIGPGPFAGMMLADHGADIIRIERLGGTASPIGADDGADVMLRGRPAIQVDLKTPEGVGIVRDLVGQADGLIEGYRPGVMERLGLGPDLLLGLNPALVYGRMTGWGQTGPKAADVGHDINYLALSGTLHMLGRAGECPTAPANLLGDYGGGGLLLAFGMCAAIIQARASGQGQVVDCAMVDGSALLATLMWSLRAQDQWRDERGSNFLDSGAHFYDTYRTRDDRFIAVGAIEKPFYRTLCSLAGMDDPAFENQFDRAAWPDLKRRVAAIFATRTRDEWCALLEQTDACVAPVLSMEEAPRHPHNRARDTFVEAQGIVQPTPAPRFSRTTARHPSQPGPEPLDILQRFGLSAERAAELEASGTLAFAQPSAR